MNRITLAFAIAATLAAATAQSQTYTAPSSSQTPYLVPTVPGVETHSILTVGDSVNLKPDGTPYRMVGIPDGLGAYDNNDGTFTVLMNHELGATVGIARAHGGIGSFVSKWIVNKDTFEVVSGEDLIKQALGWTGSQWAPLAGAANNLGRLCSADLPAVSAFFDGATGRGTQERVFMNGEEAGVEGRAFAHVATGDYAGKSYQLPWLGRFSWENAVAKAGTGAKTVVVGTDDGTGGQVYVYIGDKTDAANPVEAAGLTNGKLYGLKIGAGSFAETNGTVVADGTRFSLVELGDVSALTGAQLETLSNAKQVANMNRPEDASWDPTDPSTLYFATTAAFNGISRLWQLRLDDPADILLGGSVRVVTQSPAFDAAKSSAEQAGPRMLDNLTVSGKGQVIAVEDVGGQPYIGGVWQIDPASGTTVRVAQHDPARFTPGVTGFLTLDEEASGVIPLKGILGESWFLIDVQSHRGLGGELVEDGQLLAIKIPPRNIARSGKK
ncbi:MAG: hypothetical protein RL261_2649 [Pseudomonadota bacterium]